MKISLIHCKINYDNMEPYGILLLGTILKEAGHNIQIVDIFPEDQSIFLNQIRRFQPDLIGFSIETPAYFQIREVNDFLQKNCPQAIRCAGGAHTTAMPEQTLDDLSLDFVIRREADISFPQVVSELSHNGNWRTVPGVCYQDDSGGFIENPPAAIVKNLDELPVLDRRLIPYHQFYFSAPGNIRGMFNDRSTQIMTTRGCPFDCIFCASNVIFGKNIRRRSVEHVLKEIEYLQQNFAIQTVCFIDDTFTIKPSWVIAFCQQLLEKNIKLTWCCQSRADSLTHELLTLMKRAGCVQVDIGVESGSPRVLKALRKGEDVETLEKAVHLVKEVGLRALCTFVVGSPEETEEDVELTVNFIRRTQPTMSQYFTLIPYPGSQLYKQARTKGWLVTDGFDGTWSHKCSFSSPMQINFTSEELLHWRAKLENLNSMRDNKDYFLGLFRHPRYLLRMIGSLITYATPIRKALVTAMRKRRMQVFLLEVYKRFNQYMLKRVLKKQKGFDL